MHTHTHMQKRENIIIIIIFMYNMRKAYNFYLYTFSYTHLYRYNECLLTCTGNLNPIRSSIVLSFILNDRQVKTKRVCYFACV